MDAERAHQSAKEETMQANERAIEAAADQNLQIDAAAQAEETVIIGGGPGGMILAYLLVQGGQKVHVIERHPDFMREFRGEGIQASVVRLLRQLDLLDELLDKKIAVEAKSAQVFLKDKLVAVLAGDGDEEDFGIILYQEHFLTWMHERMLKNAPLYGGSYRVTFNASADSFLYDDISGRARALSIREGTSYREVQGKSFVVAAGRGTGLKKALGIESKNVDTHFNILWIRMPPPEDKSLLPNGFKAHLNGEALFILYATSEGGIQVAWSRRDEKGLKERDFDKKKEMLLKDAPTVLQDYLKENFTKETKTHPLRVQSDLAEQWYKSGVILLGDAAHTMSPVGGQGINLAIRDAVVLANLILDARQNGEEVGDALGEAFQKLREPEVVPMQTFQRKLGYFMLGAPAWQIKAFFNAGLPILSGLGIKQKLLSQVQSGVTDIQFEHLPTTAVS